MTSLPPPDNSVPLFRYFGFFVIAYACFVASIKPAEAILAAAILMSGAYLLVRYRHPFHELRPYFLCILAYVTAGLLSTICMSPSANLFVAIIKGCTVFMGFILGCCLKDEKQIGWSLAAFVFSIAALSSVAIVQGFWLHVERPPTLMDPVHAGYVISYGLVLVLVYLQHYQAHRIPALISTAVIGTALLLTSTRAAWFAVLISITVLSVMRPNRKIYLSLATTALIALFLIPATRERLRQAYDDLSTYHYGYPTERSLYARLDMWQASVVMFKSSPIVGIGPGNWQKQMHQMIEQKKASPAVLRFNQPHNMYLNALAVTGIIGGIALLALAVFPLYFAWLAGVGKSFFADALFASSLTFMIQGLTDSVPMMHRPFKSYLFITGICMAGILATNRAGTTMQTANEHGSCNRLKTCEPKESL